MKWLLVILSVTLLVVVGCGEKGEQQAQEKTSVQEQQPLNITVDMLAVAVDPNCGMDLHKTAVKDTNVYKDKLYGFCSTGCKTAFLKNPEEKLAKLSSPTTN